MLISVISNLPSDDDIKCMYRLEILSNKFYLHVRLELLTALISTVSESYLILVINSQSNNDNFKWISVSTSSKLNSML